MEMGDQPWYGNTQAEAAFILSEWSRELVGSVTSRSDLLALN